MQIYLLQHGQALGEEIDPQRHLSSEGRAQIEKTSIALKRMGVSFDLLLSSPKARARESAEIVGGALSYPLNEIEITDTLNPNSSPEDFIHFLSGFKDRDSILIAGHLPSLHSIALWLLCETCKMNIKFEMGGILRIDVERLPTHNGVLRYYLLPEHLNIISESIE
ncbi:MAG: phosphohistidine phosphatase SixA [Nitrospinae bacterium]|nr:phosphohistidine phosphatase SixA [Nitrospinota bacterium]